VWGRREREREREREGGGGVKKGDAGRRGGWALPSIHPIHPSSLSLFSSLSLSLLTAR